MTMPWRRFSFFERCGLYGYDTTPVGVPFDNQSDWNSARLTEIKIGDGKYPGAPHNYKKWNVALRPTDPTYKDQTSLEHAANIKFGMSVSGPSVNTAGVGSFYLKSGFLVDEWIDTKATGQTYDGVTSWSDYPPNQNCGGGFSGMTYSDQIVILDCPKDYAVTLGAWSTFFSYFPIPSRKDDWYRSGVWFEAESYDIGSITADWPNGEFYFNMELNDCVVKYFDPIVNSISSLFMPSAGGVEIVLTGLGFNNSDADIEEGGDHPAFAWEDDVSRIHFEGLQGQGTTAITSGAGDFTVDSNTQITIHSMPPLAAGTYEIRLEKWGHATTAVGGVPEGYAGDWNCSSYGLVFPGRRLTFLVVDGYTAGDGEIVFTKWTFKKKNGDTATYWFAPIDISSPNVFYEGRILSMSTLTRGIESKTGLYNISDMTVELANNDKFFSKILAEYMLKNQIVEFFHGKRGDPESFKSPVIKMIVENHSRPGASLSVTLKDITRKYFASKVPLYFCGETEYPDIHDTGIGKPMPEVLGLCSKTTGDNPGAVEAVYVDTVNYEYLAARGSLKEVLNVYSQGSAQVEGVDYSVVYKDGGRTYLVFTSDQEDNAITFNAKGYFFGPWNSAAGYVQSPAYVLAFFLALIKEIPIDYLDLAAFADLHALFTNLGYDTAAHLAIQEVKDVDDELARFLFTFGINQTIDLSGRVSVEKKDITNFSTDLIIYDQIDLIGPADRNDNLQDAVNFVNYKWNWNPNPASHASADEAERTPSITDYEAWIEPDTPWEFPWTDDDDLASDRVTELLIRFGYGDFKISFTLPLSFMDDLDLLTNFRFQDPYGLSLDGSGESGRYYYVESIGYNLLEGTMDVTALDLTWLLMQYFILGDENAIPAAWLDATEPSRMYGYLCDEITGLFSDGEPGKILIDENYV